MPAHGPAPVDHGLITDLLEALVRIPSVNPDLVLGAPGEGEAARYLASACARLGMRVSVEEAAPGRPNVVAVLPGADPAQGRSLLLNGHIDTVGTAGMEGPFTPLRRGDRLYGRGAFDMKGSLAAMIGAVAAVRASVQAPLGDVILTFVADEEYLSIGTAAIARAVRADAAIVTEPTALDLCVAHKGFLWATVRTEGRAAHGSDYGAGVDAIRHMGRVLAAIERLDRDVLPRRAHPLLGRPSVHASVIEGGEGLSTYPPSCRLALERRTLPDEREEDVRAEFQAILDTLSRDDPQFHAALEVTAARPGLEADPRGRIAEVLHRVCAGVRGAAPAHVGVAYWCDAALLAEAGIPTVIFGPAGAGAHARVEYVDLASVVTCARILAGVITEFCGVAEP